MRWLWLTLIVVAVILVPFFLFEDYFTGLADRAVSGDVSVPWAVTIIAGLLAVDVLLPVPSSVVSAAAGLLLGFWLGATVVWVAMTVSCLIAYAIGASSVTLTRRIVGEDGLLRASRLASRYGALALVFCRPVPVLAEASVIFAGMTKLPFGHFLAVTTLANLGVAVAYAAVGAYSMRLDSFLAAFAGAILLPAVAWLVAQPFLRRVAPGEHRGHDAADSQ
ncbi:MAG: VTT domain-containing protein [Acidobacteriota bacterium]|jgi:uncharacterized membrane protein YdjX (TVP38/TMEM64 family)|nr:MAG: DedA family protein [Acidobacteriota bacterium]